MTNRYPSKTAAQAAYNAHQRATLARWWASTDTWITCTTTAAAELNDALGQIAALHLPKPGEWEWATAGDKLACSPCSDCCYGSPDFPCSTLVFVLAALPDHPYPPVLPRGRPFSDFWVDPMVEVQFAHFTAVAYRSPTDGSAVRFQALPGHYAVVPLAYALSIPSRLTADTRLKIASMA